MTSLLIAVGLFAAVYMFDYAIYNRNTATYQFVSHRTYVLFISGQAALLLLFFPYFGPFLSFLITELVFISILLLLFILFSYVLTHEKLLVCNNDSRTERCLTPGYVLVKGAEITFQQLAYLVVALSVADLIGIGVLGFMLYTVILLIMHTPVILSMNRPAAKHLSIGILLLSVPIFYIFTHLSIFWPAIYLHGLLYVFLWLAFADWEGKIIVVPHETQ